MMDKPPNNDGHVTFRKNLSRNGSRNGTLEDSAEKLLHDQTIDEELLNRSIEYQKSQLEEFQKNYESFKTMEIEDTARR
jgi:hypothetical protein